MWHMRGPDGQVTGHFRWPPAVPDWLRANYAFLTCQNENDTMSMYGNYFQVKLSFNLVYIQNGPLAFFVSPSWIPTNSSFRVGDDGYKFL